MERGAWRVFSVIFVCKRDNCFVNDNVDAREQE
jgi:hypothetical protein